MGFGTKIGFGDTPQTVTTTRAPAVAKSQLQKIQSNLKDLVNTVVREGVI